jgi:outer membrane protein assembly factor BamB
VGEQSVLFAVDAATGQELWHSRFEDSRTLFASPVVFRRKVYVGGDFTVAVYAAGREKRCLGRYEVSGAYTNTPEFTSDTMILSAGSSLLAVKLPALQ